MATSNLLALPEEILVMILSFALAPLESEQEIPFPCTSIEYANDENIMIVNGEFFVNTPTALFYVNRRIYQLAKHISFSENGFILYGYPAKSLLWLQQQSVAHTKLIRRLILRTPARLISRRSHERSWCSLVAALPTYLNISLLHLSLDTSRLIIEYEEVLTDDPIMRTGFARMVEPFHYDEQFKDIKSLSLYRYGWESFIQALEDARADSD